MSAHSSAERMVIIVLDMNLMPLGEDSLIAQHSSLIGPVEKPLSSRLTPGFNQIGLDQPVAGPRSNRDKTSRS